MSKATRPDRSRVRAASTGFALAVLAVSGALTGAGTASADNNSNTSTPSAKAVCGYYPVGMYRHCDGGTGTTVMLDVRDIFGGVHTQCVGPGVTNLQPGIRWRVVDAWWNGGVHCIPGLHGSHPD
jgi:hypothetical protein